MQRHQLRRGARHRGKPTRSVAQSIQRALAEMPPQVMRLATWLTVHTSAHCICSTGCRHVTSCFHQCQTLYLSGPSGLPHIGFQRARISSGCRWSMPHTFIVMCWPWISHTCWSPL